MSEQYGEIYDKEMKYYYPYDNINKKILPLSDTVELLNEKTKRIAELQQELELMRNRVRDTFDYCEDVKKALPKRDLEQQAKGVEDFEKLFSFYDSEKDCELVYSEDAISYCARLRKQAANLKGKSNDN